MTSTPFEDEGTWDGTTPGDPSPGTGTIFITLRGDGLQGWVASWQTVDSEGLIYVKESPMGSQSEVLSWTARQAAEERLIVIHNDTFRVSASGEIQEQIA